MTRQPYRRKCDQQAMTTAQRQHMFQIGLAMQVAAACDGFLASRGIQCQPLLASATEANLVQSTGTVGQPTPPCQTREPHRPTPAGVHFSYMPQINKKRVSQNQH